MKKYILLTVLIAARCTADSQTVLQQQTDSVAKLVKEYFNTNDAGRLYSLAGEAFKKQLSPETFQGICDNNLFPLGKMNELSAFYCE